MSLFFYLRCCAGPRSVSDQDIFLEQHNTGVMQPIDAWLIKKIDELVKDGVKNINEMKRHLTFYIKNVFWS